MAKTLPALYLLPSISIGPSLWQVALLAIINVYEAEWAEKTSSSLKCLNSNLNPHKLKQITVPKL